MVRWFDSTLVHVTSPPLVHRREVALTPAEYRVIRALAFDGASNRLIAKRLFCTDDTVKTHVKNALAKASLHDRTALVVAVWSGRIEFTTTLQRGPVRSLLHELWSMYGHPSAIDAPESA